MKTIINRSYAYTLQYRVLFILWISLLVLQFMFPGFEARGLFAGLIIGWWVLELVQVPVAFTYEHTLLTLICMTVICGTLTWLCYWLMAKARHSRSTWILFLSLILTGTLIFAFNGSSYREWAMSPIVQQAVNSPEVSYEANRRDYTRTILIPRTIAGGLWGFYASAMLFGLIASIKLISRSHLRSVKQTHPTQGD